jgi:hypothetical protein
MHDTAQHNLFQVTKSKLHDLHYYYSGRWNPTNACMQHACLLNNELVWKELKKIKTKKTVPLHRCYATHSLAQATGRGWGEVDNEASIT